MRSGRRDGMIDRIGYFRMIPKTLLNRDTLLWRKTTHMDQTPTDWQYQHILRDIDVALYQLATEARRVKALILTESDLKCLIYKYLTEIPALSYSSPTINPDILGIAVHTEVSW